MLGSGDGPTNLGSLFAFVLLASALSPDPFGLFACGSRSPRR